MTNLRTKGNVAYCGLTCDGCPIHWIGLQRSEAEQEHLRQVISKGFSEISGQEYPPEFFTACDGCRTDHGQLFSGCKECPVRQCAREHGFHTCADCDEYPCADLEKTFEMDPAARSILEIIRTFAGAV